MAEKSVRAVPKRSSRPASSDGDGNEIRNEILLSLPREECGMVFSRLEFVRLKALQVLHEVGDSVRSAYFCNTGMISTLSVFPDGKSVEVGLVGKEGFLGLPLVAGLRSSSVRANVQIEGTAFRIDAAALVECLQRCPALMQRLLLFSQVMTMQVTQIAACNRIHSVEERLARWLLMCADRAGDHRLPLTQELLGQMLGTRRASVTIAAGVLQRAGFIDYRRGEVMIVNRQKLEETTCVCYQMIQQQIEKWRNEAS
ncbi:MAG: Crp/Fnr family transcriptional regulator [Candidatus Sulfotelmatobacter sp.]